MDPLVQSFHDGATGTVSHVVHAGQGTVCAVIDPVLDYEPRAGRTGDDSIGRLARFLADHALTLDWILETHVHADHLSGAQRLKERCGGRVAIGANVVAVQRHFAAVFNPGADFAADGRQFNHLFAEGERFAIGDLAGAVMFTPGHTPDSVTYVVGDAAFVGDTLFMPDGGVARCDFPGGDAEELHRSIERILSLPPETRVFVCHDYMPCGREPRWQTTVAEERAGNIHYAGLDAASFVAKRRARDATLEPPTLIIPAVQVNMRAGHLPAPEANGARYLKVPIDRM
jgi:glyoxylase-like metal-dependent hydrolase (beta-lactamase superfamily II)